MANYAALARLRADLIDAKAKMAVSKRRVRRAEHQRDRYRQALIQIADKWQAASTDAEEYAAWAHGLARDTLEHDGQEDR